MNNNSRVVWPYPTKALRACMWIIIKFASPSLRREIFMVYLQHKLLHPAILKLSVRYQGPGQYNWYVCFLFFLYVKWISSIEFDFAQWNSVRWEPSNNKIKSKKKRSAFVSLPFRARAFALIEICFFFLRRCCGANWIYLLFLICSNIYHFVS